MSNLEWARSTMALSLAFHIIFASISMVLPFYMAISHARFLRGGGESYLRLTKAWSKGAAVLFATGAVSGTALSFQLGLLWPGFMQHAGPIIGMPFSLEGAAFFLEAIFLGLFLYGFYILPARWHYLAGVMVGICGLASGILVIAANGWMNAPRGFTWEAGVASNIDPWAAMFNQAWPLQATHMLLAAFQATGCAAAGVHAYLFLRGPKENAPLHSKALAIILPLSIFASLAQPIVGDLSAKAVAERQPEKLAALEAHFTTEAHAPLLIGGIVDESNESVSWAIEIPGALSFLAFGDFDAEVVGLDQFAQEDRPPVAITHTAFQVMVGLGSILFLLSAWLLFCRFRWGNYLPSAKEAWALVLVLPLGFIALEAGWVVTEVGRQPWVLYHIIRTEDAVTQVPAQQYTFFVLLLLYLFLGTMTAFVLRKIFQIELSRDLNEQELRLLKLHGSGS